MTQQVHPDARWQGKSIGPKSSIGPFSTVGEDVTVGADCAIGNHVSVEHGAQIGDGTRVGDGARVGGYAVVGSGVSLGANCALAPRQGDSKGEPTVVEDHAELGVGALVAAGVRLGLNCVVRPGAVVLSDVPPHAIVEGNPARIVGYMTTFRLDGGSVNGATVLAERTAESRVPLEVGETALWRLPRFVDLRGGLVATDFASGLPFVPERVFFVFDVPGEKVRGEHAHRVCAQLLIAVHGALSVVVDDGQVSQEIRLDEPNVGLLLPAGIWGIQYRFSDDAVLAVLASTPYDADDYIRSYDEFLQFVKE